jgi:hypothetical protein
MGCLMDWRLDKIKDMEKSIAIIDEIVLSKIYLVREKRVMLDSDLAELYGVETKVFNQSIKRNIGRFPEDFMFKLSEIEWQNLKSQYVTSSWGGRRYTPNVFTEQGVAMLSSVLNSETAINVNIQIIRVFTKMRQNLLNNKNVILKIEQLEKNLLKQDLNFKKHEEEIQYIFESLKLLVEEPPKTRKRIGFKKD